MNIKHQHTTSLKTTSRSCDDQSSSWLHHRRVASHDVPEGFWCFLPPQKLLIEKRHACRKWRICKNKNGGKKTEGIIPIWGYYNVPSKSNLLNPTLRKCDFRSTSDVTKLQIFIYIDCLCFTLHCIGLSPHFKIMILWCSVSIPDWFLQNQLCFLKNPRPPLNNDSLGNTWVFPTIMVPPNHPF